MPRKFILDISDPHVVEILSNPKLCLNEMASLLGISSVYAVCRSRKRLGLGHLYSASGLNRPMTNRERKARYNAKRKKIGWKYLYQAKDKLPI